MTEIPTHKRRTTRSEPLFPEIPVARLLPAFGVAVAVGVLALLLWVFRFCYFQHNPVFTLPSLANVTIEGSDLPADTVLSLLRIEKGMSLFQLDTDALRRKMVEDMPAVKEVAIRLILPDQIAIALEEREPIARVAENRLYIDMDGVVFNRRLRAKLPVIEGLGNYMDVQPGAQLPASHRAVLDLAAALQRNKYAFQVERINFSDPETPKVTMSDHRTVALAWDGIETPSPSSVHSMEKQLALLSEVYRSPFSRDRLHFNATVQGRIAVE